MCKFTPLEFETIDEGAEKSTLLGVNLLHWSLKLGSRLIKTASRWSVNLLHWSLKLFFV